MLDPQVVGNGVLKSSQIAALGHHPGRQHILDTGLEAVQVRKYGPHNRYFGLKNWPAPQQRRVVTHSKSSRANKSFYESGGAIRVAV